MGLFKNFRFALSGIYGLPNWKGLLLFAIMGLCFWFSIENQSSVQQWISILLTITILIYLLELSDPFRFIKINDLGSKVLFANEEHLIKMELENPSLMQVEGLAIRLGKFPWTVVSGLKESEKVHIGLLFKTGNFGFFKLPRVQIQLKTSANLFLVWQNLKMNESYFALPQAVDHLNQDLAFHGPARDDFELSHLEHVRDERLLVFADQKMLMKTGKRFQRTYVNVNQDQVLVRNWEDLEALPKEKRLEQFSFWIKQAEPQVGLRKPVIFEAPFFNQARSKAMMDHSDWQLLKKSYAIWLQNDK